MQSRLALITESENEPPIVIPLDPFPCFSHSVTKHQSEEEGSQLQHLAS